MGSKKKIKKKKKGNTPRRHLKGKAGKIEGYSAYLRKQTKQPKLKGFK